MGLDDERWTRNFEATKKRAALKKRAVDFLGGKCHICGYDRCMAAMDFHHPNPMVKEFPISAKTVWDEKLEQELKKTFLVCSNCHREIHAGWHPGMIVDGLDY